MLFTLYNSCLENTPEEKVDGQNWGLFTPLHLPEAQLRNIYLNNHVRLHPKARKVNVPLALSHAEELLDGIKNGSINYNVEGENKLEINNLTQIIDYFQK